MAFNTKGSKQLTVLALLGTLFTCLPHLATADQKLGYVFELVRHGARAPQLAMPGKFNVPTGMLTSSGMRQRYLIGLKNKQKYVDGQGLIDEVYNPTQFYAQSTNVFRAIQSTYAEIIGIYQPQTSSSKSKLTLGEIKSMKSSKGMPKLKIRNGVEGQTTYTNIGMDKLNDGDDPMNGFQYVPVLNYLTADPNDDLLTWGCDYVQAADNYYYPRNDTYVNVSAFLMPVLRGPIKAAFGLTDDEAWAMSFPDIYSKYSDSALAEDFEGLPRRYSYTPEQWYDMRNAQKWGLSLGFPDDVKQIFGTKMFRFPL